MGDDPWCAENDSAYRAEMAEIHRHSVEQKMHRLRAENAALQSRIKELEDALATARREGMRAAAEIASLNSWRHEGEDSYSKGMDAGARHQVKVIYDAIRTAADTPTEGDEDDGA